MERYRKRLTFYLRDGVLDAEEEEQLKDEFGGYRISKAEHFTMLEEIQAAASPPSPAAAAGAAAAAPRPVPKPRPRGSLPTPPPTTEALQGRNGAGGARHGVEE
eukprot:gene30477-2720_t